MIVGKGDGQGAGEHGLALHLGLGGDRGRGAMVSIGEIQDLVVEDGGDLGDAFDRHDPYLVTNVAVECEMIEDRLSRGQLADQGRVVGSTPERQRDGARRGSHLDDVSRQQRGAVGSDVLVGADPAIAETRVGHGADDTREGSTMSRHPVEVERRFPGGIEGC